MADAPIGNLVAKLVLDSTGWRTEFQKSQKDVEGFSRNVRRHTGSASQAFREISLTTRQLGGTLASTLSPQLGQTISLFGSLGSTVARLPFIAGAAAVGLTALTAAILPMAQQAQEALDSLKDLQFAIKAGDIDAVTASMQKQAKAISDVGTVASQTTRAQQQGRVPELFKSVWAALTGDASKAREHFGRAVQQMKADFEDLGNVMAGTSQKAGETAAKAGEAFRQMLPERIALDVAKFSAEVLKLQQGFDGLETAIAENTNDLERYEQQTLEAMKRSAELGAVLSEIAERESALNRIRIAATIPDPAARKAALDAENDALDRQIKLIQSQVALQQKTREEAGRRGRLGIIERRQAAFPPEPGLEETGLRESLMGAPRGVVGAAFPDVLAKAQDAVKGFDTALADLERQARIIGPTFDLEAAQLAALSTEFQRVSGFGDQFDDKLKELSDRMKRLGVDKAMKDLANSTRIAEEEAIAFNQALTGSGETIDTVRSRYAALIETMRELIRQRQGSSEEFRRLARELEELRGLVYLKDLVSETFGALTTGINSSIQGVITGTQTLKEAFANLGQSIVLTITQVIINRGLKVLEQAVQDLLNSPAVRQFLGSLMGVAGAATAGGTAPAGAAPTGITWGQGLASGAVVKARAGGVPVIVAEGGQDEAIIPLNRAMGQLGGGVTVVNEIHNHAPDAQVETRQQRGSNGQILNQIIIRAIQGAADNGSLDKTLGRNYGLTRTGR